MDLGGSSSNPHTSGKEQSLPLRASSFPRRSTRGAFSGLEHTTHPVTTDNKGQSVFAERMRREGEQRFDIAKWNRVTRTPVAGDPVAATLSVRRLASSLSSHER